MSQSPEQASVLVTGDAVFTEKPMLRATVIKKVALLGKGKLAIRIGEWFRSNSARFELIAVVPVIPEPTWTDSLLDWGKANHLRVCSDHTHLPPGLDLVFSCFYDKILRADFINSHQTVLNLHNGPLPKYRGVNPINWALRNGEREHGVTIHEITPGIDDGPILSQTKFTIYPECDEVRDVYNRALEYGWVLFKTTIPVMDMIKPVQQDNSQASYYSSKDRPGLGDRSSWTRRESRQK